MQRRRSLIILALLTVFAGVIRFTRLSHPCLWFDESMVFWRTCGSYGQLLDCLRTDGFVPLHYSLIWVITRFVRPTPFVLRFIPALSGTLMVPAVYFLARQLLSRSTSLLAAAFTACSAFMLYYSRDAKMYMDAWLFVTLNTACLLWWFRSRTSTAWLCWIASGCIACGLQSTSAIPVAISSLLLLTQSKVRWQCVLLWVLGVFVILSGPVGYYEKFNVWKNRVDRNWNDSGLQWIGAYNYGRTGPQLVRMLGTTTLMGWEWPKDADLKNIPEARVDWPGSAAYITLGILALALLPWPRRWRFSTSPGTPGEGRGEGDLEFQATLDIPNHPHPTVPELSADREKEPEPQWRVTLWLSFLIIIPVYGFYCRSMPDFAAPLDAWRVLSPTHPALWVIIALIFISIIAVAIKFPSTRCTVRRGLAMLAVILAMLGLCQGIAIAATIASKAAADAGKPWESLWVPRYIAFIWPALAVAVAALIMRLPTRPVRIMAICFVLGLNLGIAGFRIFGQTEPPVDRMAADAFYTQNPEHRTLVWMNLQPGRMSPGGENLFNGPGQYYLELLKGRPTTPVEFNNSIMSRWGEMKFWSVPWYRDLPANVDRIIIWNEIDLNDKHPMPEPPPAPAGWKLVDEQSFIARDCWIWQDLFRYHRAVWERQIRIPKPESPNQIPMPK